MDQARDPENGGGGGGGGFVGDFDNDDNRHQSTAQAENVDTWCDCSDKVQQCPMSISMMYPGGDDQIRNYLEFHAANYRLLNPHATVHLQEMDAGANDTDDAWKEQPRTGWDAVIVPANRLGALAESETLWDLTEYVQGSNPERQARLNWADIQPFVRSMSATYADRTMLIPLDGDVLHLFYRRDLFEQHQIAVPRTWEEYQQAAAYFHGKPWGPSGSPLVGSCVSLHRNTSASDKDDRNDLCNAYWASLVLSSMTQTQGTTQGYLLDPITLQPLLGSAMEETLRILSDQSQVGPVEEILGPATATNRDPAIATMCGQANARFNEGTCALTYNWGTQLTMGILEAGEQQFDIGVAPTPGSSRVYNRATGELEECTAERCPFGIHYPDLGIINQSPYAAFGGWMGGVSNATPDSQKKAAADFLSYMSNPMQSLPDVLAINGSTFAQPYRYSHVVSSDWIQAGLEEITAMEYTDTVQTANSQNAVMDLRVPPGTDLRTIMDEEVYVYLLKIRPDALVRTDAEASALRREVTARMDQKMQQSLAAVMEEVPLAKLYQKSLGVATESHDSMNYIDPNYRSACWGVGGLMCSVAILLMIWTLWNRKNRVMQAFQPFLLVQSAVGLFLMSGTIIPLGFDDSLFNNYILNITCMASPWIYVTGFSFFFSSAYSKIRVCIRICKAPSENDVLLVRPCDYFRTFVPLILVNAAILVVWTLLDPVKWIRQEVEGGKTFPDGTVEMYGSCRGENYEALFFFLGLFAFNLLLCFVGTLQAFQCRFLVLEYNEMQWLPLSLLPFFETWVVGGPVLVLVKDDPTSTFVLFTIVIAASSICAALAVFAPKDWYIRKLHSRVRTQEQMDLENGCSSTPIHPGVLVLKHPTVESQKRLEKLRKHREKVTSYNTELEIDIRMLRDKFHHLTQQERLLVVESLAGNDKKAQATTTGNYRVCGVEDYEPAENTCDNMAAIEMDHFASVWSMPNEDEEEDDPDIAGDEDERGELANSFSFLVAELQGVRLEGDRGLSEEAMAGIAAGGAAAAGYAATRTRKEEQDKSDKDGLGDKRYQRNLIFASTSRTKKREGKTSKVGSQDASASSDEQLNLLPSSNNSHLTDEKGKGAHGVPFDATTAPKSYQSPATAFNHDYGSGCASSLSDDDNMEEEKDELQRLTQKIEFDDLHALEMETSKLAEQFKLNSHHLESILDLQSSSNNKKAKKPEARQLDFPKVSTSESIFAAAFSPARTAMTASTDEMNDTSSSTDEVFFASAGESSGGIVASGSWDRVASTSGTRYSQSIQNAGEPSGDTCRADQSESFQATELNQDDELKPHLPTQYMSGGQNQIPHIIDKAVAPKGPFLPISPINSSTGSELPTNPTISNQRYALNEWSAVGATGGLLADISDSQSTSSYGTARGSYYDSSSSVDAMSTTPFDNVGEKLLEEYFAEDRSSSDNPLKASLVEIDELLAPSDFGTIQGATSKAYYNYDLSSSCKVPGSLALGKEDKLHGHLNSIDKKRQRKRNLEASRLLDKKHQC